MYNGGLSSVIFGWGKCFASGSKLTGPGQLILIIAWIAFSFSFLANSADTAAEEPFAFCLNYLVISLLLYRTLKKIGNFTFGDALLFPLHLLFFYSCICVFAHLHICSAERFMKGP
jgi:4,4'-diaponeurosporenoate glycosyltransferase